MSYVPSQLSSALNFLFLVSIFRPLGIGKEQGTGRAVEASTLIFASLRSAETLPKLERKLVLDSEPFDFIRWRRNIPERYGPEFLRVFGGGSL